MFGTIWNVLLRCAIVAAATVAVTFALLVVSDKHTNAHIFNYDMVMTPGELEAFYVANIMDR